VSNHKLTEREVIRLKQLRRSGLSFSRLAKAFGVSYGVVWRIVHGQAWKHVV
jgi:predicted DNA-binding protein (UPF0251 family)